MKKEILTQLLFFLSFFLLISLIKHWFSFIYLYFWFGGLIGLALPIIDHILYAYVLRPDEVVSERIRFMIRNREFKSVFNYIIATKRERSKLIFHTAYFQIIFLILTFFVITSSGSLFGRGLVLAFSLHLLIEELSDFMDRRDITSWFREIPFEMNYDKIKVYILGNVLILLFLGIFL
jgi:hypothetical protein